MTENVLVTGANGHLGYTLTRSLVERGYHVRAGIRNSDDETKSQPLRRLGVDLVELDITRPDQAKSAVEGMDGLFHVAAVFKIAGKPEEIITPTVEGALNMIRAAHQAGVKKIVYTSSGRALGNSSTAHHPLTEKDWNTRGQVPYTLAKIEAERQVRAYANTHNQNLISILPMLILGPNIHRLTESTAIIDNIMQNRYPAIPPIHLNIVDVRDVARTHIAAYEHPEASGRYIIGNSPVSLEEVIKYVNEITPVRIPAIRLTTSQFRLYAQIVYRIAAIRSQPPQITPSQAREMTEGIRYVDSTRTESELGIKITPTEKCIQDTVRWLTEHEISRKTS